MQGVGRVAASHHSSHLGAGRRCRLRICPGLRLADDGPRRLLSSSGSAPGSNLQWNTVPRLVSLVGPSRAKQITLLCEKTWAPDIHSWGLVDRLADTKGGSVDLALEWAEKVASFDPLTVRMVKGAITDTSIALNRGLSYADADQSMLTSSLNTALWVMPDRDQRS